MPRKAGKEPVPGSEQNSFAAPQKPAVRVPEPGRNSFAAQEPGLRELAENKKAGKEPEPGLEPNNSAGLRKPAGREPEPNSFAAPQIPSVQALVPGLTEPAEIQMAEREPVLESAPERKPADD